MSALRAIIYVLAGARADEWQRRCLAHIAAEGYELAGVIIDNTGGGKWDEAHQLIWSRQAEIIVVAEESHIPPNRIPRHEVAAALPGVRLPTQQHLRRPQVTDR